MMAPDFVPYLAAFLRDDPGFTANVLPYEFEPTTDQTMRAGEVVSLDALEWGNRAHVVAVLRNAQSVNLLRDMDARAHQNGAIKHLARSNAAALATTLAGQTLDASFFLFVRQNRWYAHAALAVVRSALELGARAAHVLVGRASPDDFNERLRSKDPAERKRGAAALGLRACCRSLDDILQLDQRDQRGVERLYAWLCSHGHLDVRGIEQRPAHREVYCAMAVTGWYIARLVEIVSGIEQRIALEPELPPAPLPWADEHLPEIKQ